MIPRNYLEIITSVYGQMQKTKSYGCQRKYYARYISQFYILIGSNGTINCQKLKNGFFMLRIFDINNKLSQNLSTTFKMIPMKAIQGYVGFVCQNHATRVKKSREIQQLLSMMNNSGLVENPQLLDMRAEGYQEQCLGYVIFFIQKPQWSIIEHVGGILNQRVRKKRNRCNANTRRYNQGH